MVTIRARGAREEVAQFKLRAEATPEQSIDRVGGPAAWAVGSPLRVPLHVVTVLTPLPDESVVMAAQGTVTERGRRRKRVVNAPCGHGSLPSAGQTE